MYDCDGKNRFINLTSMKLLSKLNQQNLNSLLIDVASNQPYTMDNEVARHFSKIHVKNKDPVNVYLGDPSGSNSSFAYVLSSQSSNFVYPGLNYEEDFQYNKHKQEGASIVDLHALFNRISQNNHHTKKNPQ
jgi:hypothetical protein